MYLRIAAFLFLFGFQGGLCSFFPSLTAQCDPAIKPTTNRSLRYQNRGNRCEGLYRSKVSSSNLRLVSFTQGTFRFKGEEKEVITLSTPVEAKDTVYLRATGIPFDLYYRMDALLLHRRPVRWPVGEVLARGSRTRYPRNIGLYGYVDTPSKRVFVPIRPVSDRYKPNSVQTAPYMIQFVASKRLSQVRWRLRGQTDYQLLRDGSSFYSGRPIPIRLPATLKPGRYTLEIEAKEYNRPDYISKRYDFRL
jgi:hypothetical protein